jgi:hypothetical protein
MAVYVMLLALAWLAGWLHARVWLWLRAWSAWKAAIGRFPLVGL